MAIEETVTIRVREIGSRAVATSFGAVSSASRTAAGSITKMLGLLGAIGATGAAVALFKIAQNAVSAAASFSEYETVLTTTLGSQEEANAALEEFIDLSLRGPFGLDKIVKGAQTLGLAVDGDRERVEALSNATANLAATTGLEFEAAALNISKALTSGIGAARVFNERGITPLLESISGIPDLTQASSEEVERVLLQVFGPNGPFSDAAEALDRTLGGVIGDVGDAFQFLLVEIGQSFEPAVRVIAGDVLVPFLESIRDLVKDNKDAFAGFATDGVVFLAKAFGGLVRAGIEVLRILNSLRGASKRIEGTFAQIELSSAERRLEQLRNQASTFGEIANPAGAAEARARLADAQARVDALREIVDGLASEVGNSNAELDKFEGLLDRLTRQTNEFEKGIERAAEGIRDAGNAAAESRPKFDRGGVTAPDTSDAGIGAFIAGRPGFRPESGGGVLAGAGEDFLQGTEEPGSRDLAKLQSEAFGEAFSRQASEVIGPALRGEAIDFADVLARQSERSLETALTDTLTAAGEKFGELLQKSFDGIDFGGLGGAFAGAIGIGLSIVAGAIKGSSATTRAGLAGSAVTSTQALRGVVAGPTSIPIFQLGAALGDALGPTESLLLRILNAIEAPRRIGSPATVPGIGADALNATPSLA